MDPRKDSRDDISNILKPKERTAHSCFGRRRTLDDLNRWEIGFLIIGIASLLACLGLTIERLDYLSPGKCPHGTQNSTVQPRVLTPEEASQKCGSDFTFALLILINCIFCLLHTVHGVIWERPYELWVFIASIMIVTAYCVMDFVVGLNEGLSGYPFNIKLTRLIILVTLGVADVILACKIAMEFLRQGRFACSLVQTYDAVIQWKCKIHFLTQSLLTFDLQFQVTLVVLILRNGFELRVSNQELGVLIGGLVFTSIWMVAANLSLRIENKYLAWFVLITSVLEPAYIIYKIVDSANIISKDNSTDTTNLALHYSVFLGGSLGIVVRVLFVGSFFKTSLSFGERLNERIYGSPYPFHSMIARTHAESVT